MEDFIDYKTALLAKEKGLDLESNYFREQEEGQPDYDDSCENWNLYDGYCTIITKNNLQKWLREKHNFHIVVNVGLPHKWDKIGYYSNVIKFGKHHKNKYRSEFFKTYEEALEVGLHECLQMVSETVA